MKPDMSWITRARVAANLCLPVVSLLVVFPRVRTRPEVLRVAVFYFLFIVRFVVVGRVLCSFGSSVMHAESPYPCCWRCCLLPASRLPFSLSSLSCLWTDLSFQTIAGEGKNGAIIHYSAEPDSCGTVGQQSMLLIDSGTSTGCVPCVPLIARCMGNRTNAPSV